VIPRSEWLGKAHDQQGEKLQNGTLVEVRTRSKSKDVAYEFDIKGICGSFCLVGLVTGQVDERFIRKLLNERIRRMV
jgi:hypothetical protein